MAANAREADSMSNSYNPVTGLFCLVALEKCSIHVKSVEWLVPGERFYGGALIRDLKLRGLLDSTLVV